MKRLKLQTTIQCVNGGAIDEVTKKKEQSQHAMGGRLAESFQIIKDEYRREQGSVRISGLRASFHFPIVRDGRTRRSLPC